MSSVELAVIVPLLLVIIFATIQLATFHHARSTAQSAAAACAERARGFDATAADGERTGRRVITQVPGLSDPQIRVSLTNTQATCVVTGTAPVLVDLGSTAISATVTLPRERLG